MNASSVRWLSEGGGDPAPATTIAEDAQSAGSPAGPGAAASQNALAADAQRDVRVAQSAGQAVRSAFVSADPGISTVRQDPGFRSLSVVDNMTDPQTGKITSRWLGRFILESGAVLPDLVIAYRHDGVPIGEGRQILVIHALTGSADAAGDWWAPIIGPGQALDTDKYGVLCMNLLGSRYGTTGPT